MRYWTVSLLGTTRCVPIGADWYSSQAAAEAAARKFSEEHRLSTVVFARDPDSPARPVALVFPDGGTLAA